MMGIYDVQYVYKNAKYTTLKRGEKIIEKNEQSRKN